MKLFIGSIALLCNLTLLAQNKVGINTNAPLEPLDVNGNTNLRGALKINGSSGASGQVLVSNGNNVAPQWASIATSGGGRFWCLILNNSNTAGRQGFTVNGSGTQNDTIDIGSTKVVGTDLIVSSAGNYITINKTGLYHFEGNMRMFVTNSAAVTMAPRASIKVSSNEPANPEFSVILFEEMMQEENSTVSGTNDFHNVLARFSFDINFIAGTTVAFIAEFTRLKTSPDLLGIGVSAGGYLSGFLISE